MFRAFVIGSVILHLFFTTGFVWHTELYMGMVPYQKFTNGFGVFDAARVYHAWMYGMLFFLFVNSFLLLYGMRGAR